MAHEQETVDRDAAVRAMLVRQVAEPSSAPSRGGRLRVGVVTGVVLAVVVALSVLAIRVGGGRGEAPVGEGSPTPLPTGSAPAGVLLGRYTSEDGPRQTHTIHPNGLAISTLFACDGGGEYFLHIPHDHDEGGPCEGRTGPSASNKGAQGSRTLTITTEPSQRWTLTIVGIPETYVTPQPVLTPTDASGRPVPFCTGDDLSTRYQPYEMPAGVDEVKGGQIVFTNTSRGTCALAGHPGIRFLNGSTTLGRVASERTDERMSEEHGLKPVLLKPHGRAYSQLDYYLPRYYPANNAGTCRAKVVHGFRVDLANALAGPAQQGTFDVSSGPITACLDSPWGVFGKYGQLSSTVFVDYSNAKAR